MLTEDNDDDEPLDVLIELDVELLRDDVLDTLWDDSLWELVLESDDVEIEDDDDDDCELVLTED